MTYAGLRRGGAAMASEFEMWATRGLVAFLGAACWGLVSSKLKEADSVKKWAEGAMEAQRKAFQESLDKIEARFVQSLASLNATVADLATSAGQIREAVAKDYATKDDLRDARNEMRHEIEMCRDSCPDNCGR